MMISEVTNPLRIVILHPFDCNLIPHNCPDCIFIAHYVSNAHPYFTFLQNFSSHSLTPLRTLSLPCLRSPTDIYTPRMLLSSALSFLSCEPITWEEALRGWLRRSPSFGQRCWSVHSGCCFLITSWVQTTWSARLVELRSSGPSETSHGNFGYRFGEQRFRLTNKYC